jgi:hypothetical protein
VRRLTVIAAAIAVAVGGMTFAPPARAYMNLGNYDVLTNRYDLTSWIWWVSTCIPEKSADCRDISGIARRKFYYEYGGKAHLDGDIYTLVVDVPDGLRCPGQNLPTRDTYTWNQYTLAGEINSTYDVGCFGGPPGTQFWTFALQRL